MASRAGRRFNLAARVAREPQGGAKVGGETCEIRILLPCLQHEGREDRVARGVGECRRGRSGENGDREDNTELHGSTLWKFKGQVPDVP